MRYPDETWVLPVIVGAVIGVVTYAIILHAPNKEEPTMDPVSIQNMEGLGDRGSVVLWKDPTLGCEYIIVKNIHAPVHMEPRLNVYGVQEGCTP